MGKKFSYWVLKSWCQSGRPKPVIKLAHQLVLCSSGNSEPWVIEAGFQWTPTFQESVNSALTFAVGWVFCLFVFLLSNCYRLLEKIYSQAGNLKVKTILWPPRNWWWIIQILQEVLPFPCLCCVCAQSCQTLCNPMNCSPPGSSVHGISQAGTLEWVAISSSI